MPSTSPDGLVYPDSSGNTQLWTHFQNLADSVQAKFTAYETIVSWTPTWITSGSSGGFSSVGGSGVNEGHYQRIGDWILAQFYIQLASGFSVDTGIFTLVPPVAPYDWSGSGGTQAVGSWIIRDDSASPIENFAGTISHFDTTTFSFGGANNAGTSNRRVEDTIPITWASGDILSGVLNYRAA